MLRRLWERMADGENGENLMNYEWMRLQSFQTFPDNVVVSSIRLAASGFYYTGQGDCVKCYCCSFEYSDWKDHDIPSEVHRRLSPTCEFVRGTDGDNLPIHNQSDSRIEMTESRQSQGETIGKLQPKYPKFESTESRLASFQKWTNESVHRDSLAQAGFFYAGIRDCVQCFFCGGGLRNWDEGDNPLVEHAKWFGWCRFLREKMGDQFIRMHSLSDDAEASHNNESGNQNQEHSTQEDPKDTQENGNEMSARQLSWTDTKPDEESKEGAISYEGNAATGHTANDENTRLKEELRVLKEKNVCKVCYDMEANIIFMPCCHLVVCELCGPQIVKCVICRERVKSKRKVFMA